MTTLPLQSPADALAIKQAKLQQMQEHAVQQVEQLSRRADPTALEACLAMAQQVRSPLMATTCSQLYRLPCSACLWKQICFHCTPVTALCVKAARALIAVDVKVAERPVP
jgi:endonuclease/exonuclease/phosphatase (EEP) superfamily protein YafD